MDQANFFSLSQQEQAKVLLTFRERSREDVLFLAKYVLGYDLVDESLPYHQYLAEQAMCLSNTLTLCPRSFIKSTIITISGSIWYVLNNPDHCILISSSTAGNCEKFLYAITQHFTRKDSFFRLIWPEFCPQEYSEEFYRELAVKQKERLKSLKRKKR